MLTWLQQKQDWVAHRNGWWGVWIDLVSLGVEEEVAVGKLHIQMGRIAIFIWLIETMTLKIDSKIILQTIDIHGAAHTP